MTASLAAIDERQPAGADGTGRTQIIPTAKIILTVRREKALFNLDLPDLHQIPPHILLDAAMHGHFPKIRETQINVPSYDKLETIDRRYPAVSNILLELNNISRQTVTFPHEVFKQKFIFPHALPRSRR